MYKSLNKIKSIPKYVRSTTSFISQFKVEQSDCGPIKPIRKPIDPKVCKIKDKGLIIGVYYNDQVFTDPVSLTPSAKKYNEAVNGKLWHYLQLSPIPRLGESRIFYDIDPVYAYVAVVGLGNECLQYNKLEKLDQNKEAIRIAAATGTNALQPLNPSTIDVESFGNAEAAAEGASLAVWKFNEFKSIDPERNFLKPKLWLHDDPDVQGWQIGEIKAEAQNLARYLQELPANILNPKQMAKIAIDLLCDLDINVEVRTKGWAASRLMGGFVCVGKSSVETPLYVEISYYGAHECTRPIVFIGKGVTFDSGSIDLKDLGDLRYMKGDMAGAACVIAVTRAAAKLKLPVNIRGILPLCELMPNGSSPKFWDVIPNPTHKTIKLRLPSCEGRLLIADSLVYARNYWPQFIIDVGTMSKQLINFLGGSACACYSNSEELYHYMELASGETGDRIWRMPLWKFYEDRVLDSTCADVANTGINLHGDSPNCAAFLKQFVQDSRWIHLDTYNVGYTKGLDYPYLSRGMTGRPTRTLIEFLHQMIADCKL